MNDFSRTLASAVWEPQIPADAVTVFSGGTEGVLSPHITLFLREADEATTGLLTSVGHTRTLAPHEVGTEEQTRQVATTVSQLMSQIGVTPDFGQTAAYVESWLRCLKDDKRFIFKAATEAQKAADWLMRTAPADHSEQEVAA